MTAKARILFVDDEKRVLNSMRGLFRREFELFLTTEGAAAVKIAAENTIDVIVADQRMPGMTGIEVLGKVKALSPQTIRILLTGYSDQDAVEGSINVGEVFRFLSKPCPSKLLRETLDLAVTAARATRASLAARAKAVAKQAADKTDQPTKQPAAGAQPQSTTSPAERLPVLPAGTRETSAAAASGVHAAQSDSTVPKLRVIDPDIDTTSPDWQTITDVVLSGDSSQESQPGEIGANTLAMTKDIGVVVFTIDPEFAEAAIRAVSADRSTTLATTLPKVAQAIEQHHAGVLVTDFTTKRGVLQRIISVLKNHLPELVTIVVSGSRDTTDMISLINCGQVFRYLLKPVDAQSLRNELNAAAIRHMHLLKNPELTKRHQVEDFAGRSESSPTLDEFARRIRDLQSRRTSDTQSSN